MFRSRNNKGSENTTNFKVNDIVFLKHMYTSKFEIERINSFLASFTIKKFEIKIISRSQRSLF